MPDSPVDNDLLDVLDLLAVLRRLSLGKWLISFVCKTTVVTIAWVCWVIRFISVIRVIRDIRAIRVIRIIRVISC